MKPELCIGTAQFGFNYGITNTIGKISPIEIKKILNFCSNQDINLIDTAKSYGEAENVLGLCMKKGNNFKIISKISFQSKSFFTSDDQRLWEEDIRKSFNLLKKDKIEALLLHHSEDLKKPGSEYLIDWLFSIRDRGLVEKLGISIYTKEDLKILNKNLIDIIQLPISLYDQRLIEDGTINSLNKQGYQIHARSIFLQGLILKPSNKWPNWIDEPTKRHHIKLENFALENGCKLIDLAVEFIKTQKFINSAIFGVCSLEELKEIKKVWDRNIILKNIDWRNWALNDNKTISPNYWPK